MKRLISVIACILLFVGSTAFNATSDSTQVPLKQDSTTTANINVHIKTDKMVVEEKNLNLETLIEQQTATTQVLADELGTLNDKLPNMNMSPYEAKFEALNSELDITKEDYIGVMQKESRLTNLVNFLILICGIGGISWLFKLKRTKREPDIVLKLGVGVLFVVILGIVSSAGVAVASSVFNPTYKLIEQFILLGS